MNLYLIGYRCSGKTSVGKRLANQTRRRFFDCDRALVEAAGMSIKEIVEYRGWDVFREMEQEILQRVCLQDNMVVATGGGVVTRTENVEAMKKSGLIIWLKTEPGTIRQRMMADRTTDRFRPALSEKGVSAEIDETLKRRLPLYEAAMDLCLQTDADPVDTICTRIREEIEKRGYSTGIA